MNANVPGGTLAFEGWLTTENIVVLSAWLGFTIFMLVYVVPRLAARRVSDQFGLKMVEQKGRRFYAPVDPEGNPIEIPIGVKEVDGKQQVVMGYAPLAYTLPFMAADMAAMKIKMSVLGHKGNVSKGISNKMLNGLALGQVDLDEAMPLLPKNVQKWLAAARVLGIDLSRMGQGGHRAAQQTQQVITGYKPGV